METWKREITVTKATGEKMNLIEYSEGKLSIAGQPGKFYPVEQFEAGKAKLIAAGGKVEERINPMFKGW